MAAPGPYGGYAVPHGNSGDPTDVTSFYPPDANVAVFNLPPICASFELPPKTQRAARHLPKTKGAHGRNPWTQRHLQDGPIPQQLATDVEEAYLFLLECRGFSLPDMAARMNPTALGRILKNYSQKTASNRLSMAIQRWKKEVGILGDMREGLASYNPAWNEQDAMKVSRLTPLQLLFNVYWAIDTVTWTMSQPIPPVNNPYHPPPLDWVPQDFPLPQPQDVSGRVRKILVALSFPVPRLQQYPQLVHYGRFSNDPNYVVPANLQPLPGLLTTPIRDQLGIMGLPVPPTVPVANPQRGRRGARGPFVQNAATQGPAPPPPMAPVLNVPGVAAPYTANVPSMQAPVLTYPPNGQQGAMYGQFQQNPYSAPMPAYWQAPQMMGTGMAMGTAPLNRPAAGFPAGPQLGQAQLVPNSVVFPQSNLSMSAHGQTTGHVYVTSAGNAQEHVVHGTQFGQIEDLSKAPSFTRKRGLDDDESDNEVDWGRLARAKKFKADEFGDLDAPASFGNPSLLEAPSGERDKPVVRFTGGLDGTTDVTFALESFSKNAASGRHDTSGESGLGVSDNPFSIEFDGIPPVQAGQRPGLASEGIGELTSFAQDGSLPSPDEEIDAMFQGSGEAKFDEKLWEEKMKNPDEVNWDIELPMIDFSDNPQSSDGEFLHAKQPRATPKHPRNEGSEEAEKR